MPDHEAHRGGRSGEGATAGAGDPDTASFEAAKLADKLSQTRLRDLTVAKMQGELVPITEVELWAAENYGLVRSRFMAVESQLSGLTDN